MEQTTVKKETSIEWLMTQLYKKGFIKEVDGSEPINLMNQAKAMEKENLYNFYIQGGVDAIKEADRNVEQYYNETFKSE